MGKEVKIGLAIVGVLLVALTGLLLKRFVFTGGGATAEIERPAAAEPAPVAQNEKPTLIVAQKDSARTTRGKADGEAPADLPRGSFMPADSQPDARFARDDEPAPAPGSNPFGKQLAGPSDANAGDASSPPAEFEVAPGDAAALDARRPPAQSGRNPLRRLSAEEPLEAGPAANDPFPDVNPSIAPADETAKSAADGARQPQSADGSLGLEPADVAHAAESPADPSLDTSVSSPAESASDALAEPAPAEGAPVEAAPAEPRPRSRYEQPEVAETPPRAAAAPALPADGRYTIEPNDSLWKISEKVYGNGGYFKVIHEHNRAKLPQPDRLVAGTVIEVPPASVLDERYPSLCPRQRRSAVVKSRSAPPAVRQAVATSGDVYVVEEGDTLFDIARYELGKAARWGEIYALNREVLGEDFDYLQPGLELKLPARGRPADTISRQPGDRYQR